jgi:hypothetical protein
MRQRNQQRPIVVVRREALDAPGAASADVKRSS